MKPTVGSLFSGIGGFDLGLERAGWRVIWQVENDDYRRGQLCRHWPDVELRNDIRTDTDGLPTPDLICGGFPCQDLSVAGARKGLAGERSGLFNEFVRVLATLRPRWVLIENVPGLLSSPPDDLGRDFAVVQIALAELGYWWAYRILDSQYFGVPQRRRRVYIVGHFGAPCPPEVLFEREGSGGDSPPGRTSGSEVAGTLGGGASFHGWSTDPDRAGAFIPEKSLSLATVDYDDATVETYIVNARQDPVTGLQPLDRNGRSLAVAIVYGPTNYAGGRDWHELELARAVNRSAQKAGGSSGIVVTRQVRRLTPVECCRLQGFPDDWLVGVDGRRYGALGDAVTVPVAEWIGRRILEAHHAG